ncbi:MAG: sugar transferase [Elusimicrobiales bacterium]
MMVLENKYAARRFAAEFLSKFWLPAAGIALDAALVYAAFRCAWYLRFHFAPVAGMLPPPAAGFESYAAMLPAMVPLWLLVFHYSARLYSDPHIPAEDAAVRALQGCLAATFLTLALSFLLRQFWISRLVFVFLAPVSAIFVCAGNLALRAAQRALLNRYGLNPRILVAGTGKAAEYARARVGGAGRQCLSDSGADKGALLAAVRQNRIGHVVLANASLSKADLLETADILEQEGVELSILPGIAEMRTGEVQMDVSLGLPMMKIYHTSLSGPNYISKRLFDIVFSLAVMTAGFVPFLLLAALIKLNSPGPVFFRQKRIGRNGRSFEIYKFRTMVSDAEAKLEQLRHLNERSGNVFKMKDDPRLTAVGKLLRRFSIDEFPQFINVLLGDMSVAGPRPPTAGEYADYDEASKRRLRVLPGITGLWQVSGRADLDFDQMLALDFYYIEHWSLGMDLKIILKTPLAMVSSKGAY